MASSVWSPLARATPFSRSRSIWRGYHSPATSSDTPSVESTFFPMSPCTPRAAATDAKAVPEPLSRDVGKRIEPYPMVVEALVPPTTDDIEHRATPQDALLPSPGALAAQREGRITDMSALRSVP